MFSWDVFSTRLVTIYNILNKTICISVKLPITFSQNPALFDFDKLNENWAKENLMGALFPRFIITGLDQSSDDTKHSSLKRALFSS